MSEECVMFDDFRIGKKTLRPPREVYLNGNEREVLTYNISQAMKDRRNHF